MWSLTRKVYFIRIYKHLSFHCVYSIVLSDKFCQCFPFTNLIHKLANNNFATCHIYLSVFCTFIFIERKKYVLADIITHESLQEERDLILKDKECENTCVVCSFMRSVVTFFPSIFTAKKWWKRQSYFHSYQQHHLHHHR